MTKIKVCGLFREEDIDYVNTARTDYAGFILHFPKSHRNLTLDQAEHLRSRLHPDIEAVCVFVDQPLEKVVAAARRLRPAICQLHGHEDEAYIRRLREETGCRVWKAFRVREAADLLSAEASPADAVLLDNGYGTGACFDWSLVTSFPRPFLLAGGLTPENIPEAIQRLRPAGVDISSGVESNRKKDPEKILAAVRAVRTTTY